MHNQIKGKKNNWYELLPGWPGRFLFLLVCGSRLAFSFLVAEEALFSLEADVKFDIFSSMDKPFIISFRLLESKLCSLLNYMSEINTLL